MSPRRVIRPMLTGVMALLLAATLSPLGGVVAATRSSTVHYIYADDGKCPDTIDGFQITSSGLVPTPGTPYSAGPTSCTFTTTFGYNTLAVTPANTVHGPCLVHSDGSQPQVESFAIDPATGALALASTVPALNKDPFAQAKDIRIANNGNLVYVSITPASIPGNLTSLTLGAGCMLKLDQQRQLSTQSYSSILLISPSRLVAIALVGGGIDTYALTPTGGITPVNSVPGQLTAPEGVAAQTVATPGGSVTKLYTGQFRLSIMPASTAQAGRYTPSTGAFAPLASSPQTDGSGFSLDYLLFNTANHYLIGTETFGNALGVWSAPGSAFTFFGHVQLPGTVAEPTALAQIGVQLFVTARGLDSAQIVHCTITPVAPGVKNCAVAASLSGINGASEGVAIL